MKVVVLGDALLDRDLTGEACRLAPDAPVPVVADPHERVRAGGAALAATLAAGLGADVTFVTALADDDAGAQLRALLDAAGVRVVATRRRGATPQKVRVRAGDHALVRLDYGATRAPIDAPSDGRFDDALHDAAAVLVADYGDGLTDVTRVRDSLRAVARRLPVVWDPHPRGAVAIPGATVVTPNRRELAALSGADASTLPAAAAAARALARRWQVHHVAATLDADGALLSDAAHPALVVPAPRRARGDACGAGDCFAAAATVELARGAVVSEAVTRAVHEATAYVARGGAGAANAPSPRSGRAAPTRAPAPARAHDVVAATRAAGGTVVATGGCFDLLHAGHVQLLEQARALGDCLVVLLNSDASIRRLKGPTRPLQTAADRAAVLQSLGCVDAVEVFDDETPVRALEALRPDLFVKGGDYALSDLVEVPALARWGGECVIVPYLAGRSTTALLEEATRRGQ